MELAKLPGIKLLYNSYSFQHIFLPSLTNRNINISRYHLERKIFCQLLELKRLQIRAGQHNEAILVKRAIDDYHRSCASTVGAGKYVPQDFSFEMFEKFLYDSLKQLQKNGSNNIIEFPEASAHPLHCTKTTNRCIHATHAYTGVPCAAYCKFQFEIQF